MSLRRIILFLYSLLLCITPLILSTATSEMFEFPKIITIYVFASCITFFTVLYIVIDPQRWRWHTLLTLYSIFLASQILSTVYSMDPHTSIFGYYGRFNGGVLSQVAYGLLLWSAIQVFDMRSFRFLCGVSLATCIIVIAWGLPARFSSFDSSCLLLRHEYTISCWTDEFRPQERMFSTLGQPNWLATYICAHFFIALSILFRYQSQIRWMRYARLAVLALLLAGVYFTGSRSAEIALVVGIGIMCWRHVFSPRSRALQQVVLAVVGVVIVTISFFYIQNLRRNHNTAITDSGTIRLIVWEGAWKLFTRYPLTGTGPETFAFAYPLTRPAAHNLTSEKEFIYNKAHNELLNYLATTGIIGLVTYLAFHGYVLKKLYDAHHHPLLAALVSIHITNFFGFSTTTSQILVYLLPVAVYLHEMAPRHLDRVQRSLLALTIRSLIGVLALSLWVYSELYLARYVMADIEYNQAVNLSQSDESYQSWSHFLQALELRYEHVYLDKFALASAQSAYLLSALSAEDPTIDERDVDPMKFEHIAVMLQDRVIASSPRNPFYWKNRARMYLLLLQYNATDEARQQKYRTEAATAIRNVHQLAPTDLDVENLRRLLE